LACSSLVVEMSGGSGFCRAALAGQFGGGAPPPPLPNKRIRTDQGYAWQGHQAFGHPGLSQAAPLYCNGSLGIVQQQQPGAWTTLPPSGRMGGPEWVLAMLERTPPCLSLHGLEPSAERVDRLQCKEGDDFHRFGMLSLPSQNLLQLLFSNLLEGVRFPPSTLELSWRAQPAEGRDDIKIPEELIGGSSLKQDPFQLLSNLADVPAEQPPHFKQYPLRPEQLRSLAWMLSREGYEGGACNQELADSEGGELEPFAVDWRQILHYKWVAASVDVRAQASYTLRGGILGDKVGFGKTATTIGLIDATQSSPTPPVPEPDRRCFIPARGTLVIVPSNLLDQWAQDISKFVWNGKRLVSLSSGWKAGRSHEDCPLKVLAISTVSPLRLVTAGEIAEVDVVLCSYRLLFSQIYQDRRDEIAGGSSLSQLMQATQRLLEGHSCPGGKSEPQTSKTLVFPVLEMFHWRRVVFDEFHELESFQSAQQSVLQYIRAHSRWGLTGTPPIDTLAGVIFMSSLFRVDIAGHLPMVKATSTKGMRRTVEVPHMLFYEDDRLMRVTAGRFLDRFVRQNTAVLAHIGLQQHIVVVRHAPGERALYLGEAYDARDMSQYGDAFLSAGNLQSLETLLKLCSHFQAKTSSGVASNSAQAECARIADQKSLRRTQAKRAVSLTCRVLLLLKQKVWRSAPGLDVDSWCFQLDKTVAGLRAQNRPCVEGFAEEERLAATENGHALCTFLAGHKPRDHSLATMLALSVDGGSDYNYQHWAAFSQRPMAPQEVRHLLVNQVMEQIENLLSFAAAVDSKVYFDRVVTALTDDEDPMSRGCCACSQAPLALERMAVTPCGHVFCMDCLATCVSSGRGTCSRCRQPLEASDCRPLVDTARGYQENSLGPSGPQHIIFPQGDVSDSKDGRAFSKYGTKIGMVVRFLQELRQHDTSVKIILFVQFDDLKNQVAAALREFGVATAQLKGSVNQRASTIRDWQENPASPTYVLLLSLAESASGTNLTAGSHVVFLNPMLSSTLDRAAAHELQAIGRARRYGQLRDMVHVWRFVTEGTVEQVMTGRHQAILWQLESEGLRISATKD